MVAWVRETTKTLALTPRPSGVHRRPKKRQMTLPTSKYAGRGSGAIAETLIAVGCISSVIAELTIGLEVPTQIFKNL